MDLAFLAFEGGVDGIACVGEGRDQLTIEIAIILNNQHPHSVSPSIVNERCEWRVVRG
jgi:hypothetical protein